MSRDASMPYESSCSSLRLRQPSELPIDAATEIQRRGWRPSAPRGIRRRSSTTMRQNQNEPIRRHKKQPSTNRMHQTHTLSNAKVSLAYVGSERLDTAQGLKKPIAVLPQLCECQKGKVDGGPKNRQDDKGREIRIVLWRWHLFVQT